MKRKRPGKQGSFNGLELFSISGHLARRLRHASRGRGRRLNGAQFFYYTHYALLRRGIVPEVWPDTVILPRAVAETFLQVMPQIAFRLRVDFWRAVRLLKDPAPLLRWRRVGAWLKNAPELHHALEQLTGVSWQREPAWPLLWQRFWRQTEREYAARMFTYLRPQRLLVVVVAHPDDDEKRALERLRQRLADDRATRSWTIPPPEVYLFEQSLVEWVLRPLLAGEWAAQLCLLLQQWRDTHN